MNSDFLLYFNALYEVNWFNPMTFRYPSENAKNWLFEQGSLSERFKRHCQTFSAQVVTNEYLNPADILPLDLSPFRRLTADSKPADMNNCLLREVVLIADGVPWVVGRTLIPNSLLKPCYDFYSQGTVPLGETVFQADNVKRDGLEVGQVELNGHQFLARRTRLWLNDKPMLVAELFLLDSPVYDMSAVYNKEAPSA